MNDSGLNTKRTIVEEGSELSGILKSNCTVVVSGSVSGEIHAPSLTVTEGGSVHGIIKVSDLRSQGEISGQIDAEMIELSGRVKDQTVIRASILEVKLNAAESQKLQIVFGDCAIEAGKEKEIYPNSNKEIKAQAVTLMDSVNKEEKLETSDLAKEGKQSNQINSQPAQKKSKEQL